MQLLENARKFRMIWEFAGAGKTTSSTALKEQTLFSLRQEKNLHNNGYHQQMMSAVEQNTFQV